MSFIFEVVFSVYRLNLDSVFIYLYVLIVMLGSVGKMYFFFFRTKSGGVGKYLYKGVVNN